MSPLCALEVIEALYARLDERLAHARRREGRPLTLAEKIFWSHRAEADPAPLARGRDFALLRPDRVALQDATAQMAILQFMQARRPRVATPTSVHCDHLIQARAGADLDNATAATTNKEVYDFLRSAAARYGMGFWKPGAGIIHQIVLENYAFPGGLMIGTDSHTPNAGGMGMAACGVGGADAVDVMVGSPWEVLTPELVGVRLKGRASGWTSGKDVILKLLEQLTVKGGTNRICEYFGPGVASLSLTARATITNMGAELGATTSLFPCDERTEEYLRATERAAVADLARRRRAHLCADPEAAADPRRFFDLVVEIDLDALEPYVVGPHSPDLARPISRLAADLKAAGWPVELSAALIGSCTNSSYEDLGRAAHVARQALDRGRRAQTSFWVSPGSDRVRATAERDGQAATLRAFGGTVLANACGPCIGQWQREDASVGQANSIVTSFNRNFKGRNDGNAATCAFIASPELVTALAAAGRLDFNPLTDALPDETGGEFRLQPPQAPALPARGFPAGTAGYLAPPDDGAMVEVAVRPESERLQVLAPFAPNRPEEFCDLPVLLKAKGKCTTDHISPAGPWLRYRGHLDNISKNMFCGAVNAFTGETGRGTDPATGATGREFHETARALRDQGRRWVVFGDENYGEGSSREHAAMSPRRLGGAAVIVRSFARIHETNLKKQGLLALHLVNAADYEKVQAGDRVTIEGLADFAPGKNLTVRLCHADGREDRIPCRHTYNEEQMRWFRAGSALNLVAPG